MHVAPAKIAEHLFRFLIESVASSGIWSEDWNGGDVSQRRNSRDINLAGMSAGIEQIIFILLSGGDVAGDRIRGALGLRRACLFSATRQTQRDGECDCVQCNSWLHKLSPCSEWLLLHCHDALGSL